MDKRLHDHIDSMQQQIDTQQQHYPGQLMQEDIISTHQPTRTLHIYLVDEPPVITTDTEDDHTIESTLEEQEEPVSEPVPLPIQERPISTPGGQLKATTMPKQRKSSIPLIFLVLCLLTTLGVIGVASMLPLWTTSATVTLMPTTAAITTTSSIPVVTGIPTAHQVPGRRLSSLTLSQAKTVPTTSTGHQDAQVAHGPITLYNASLSTQVVTAGTLLVGADGVQVVTDQDAVIPAGSLATNGRATVSAHAVLAGPGGNIRAGDIYGACCRLNVFAANGAFTGGQAARSYPMVTTQDLNSVVSTLKQSLLHSVSAAFQAQVHPDETLITPVACTPTVKSDHADGDEARQVSVTLDETCTGETYNTQALHTLMTQITTQEAAKQRGRGYALVKDVQVTVLHTSRNNRYGSPLLQVKGGGTWVYHLTQEQINHMRSRIAGKSKTQAAHLLVQQPGVLTASLSMTGSDTTTLPTNPQAIRFVVVSTVSYTQVERTEG